MTNRRLGITVALGLFICVAGIFLTWWTVVRTDAVMRKDLLHELRKVRLTLPLETIQALSGSAKDLDDPGYKRLKDQLMAVRPSIPNCHLLYLQGRNAAGKLFIFADSAAPNSKESNMPGAIDNGATLNQNGAFETRSEVVEGPYNDKCGKWISAMIPLFDPQTALYGAATRDDAKKLVEQAVDFYSKNGQKRFLEEINNPHGKFCKGSDLYVFVYDRAMTCLAHPILPALIGQNLINVKDWSGGKYFRKEMQAVALSFKGRGWVDYNYENLSSHRRDLKSTYVVGQDDLIICAGVFKGEGKVLSLLGMDIDATLWKQKLSMAALPPGLLTLALLAILLTTSVLSQGRALGHSIRYLEAGSAAAVGLVLTLFIAELAYESVINRRNQAFENLALERSGEICGALRDMTENQLEGIARFYTQKKTFGRDNFEKYWSNFKKSPAIQAWNLIQPVSAADKLHFEERIRAEEDAGFEIWQLDSKGNRVSATDRAVFYPIVNTIPRAGNERVLGFDLSSEPIRDAALNESIRTGLMTASGPVTLVQSSAAEKGMLIYQSVYEETDRKSLRGCVVAALRFKTLMKNIGSDESAILELSLLHPDKTSEQLAVFWDSDSTPDPEISVTNPFFAFGKVFTVTVYPGPEFMRLYRPIWEALRIFVVGLLFTCVLVWVLILLLRRREDLERQVLERTSALCESEERLSATLRSIGDGVIVCDKTGTVIDLNKVAETLTGWRLQEAAGRPVVEIFRIVHSQTRLEAEIPVVRAIQEDRIIELANHTVLIPRDGSERHIADSCAPIHTSEGEVIGAVLVFRDVTAEYQQRDELKESEERFVQLAEQNRTITLEVDPEGVVIHVSHVVEQVLGYRPDELIDKKYFYDFYPESKREDLKTRTFEMFKRKETLVNNEAHLQAKDGSLVWCTWTFVPNLNPDGTVRTYRASIVDINARKQAEEKMRLQSEALSAAANAIVITNSKGVIEWINPAFTKFTGYSAEEAIGLTPAILLSGQHDAAFYKKLWSTVLAGKVWQGEMINRHKNGSFTMEEMTITPILNHLGEITHFISVKQDITERKRAEADLQQAETELRHAQKMESIGNLAAGIAHEINTPVQFLLNNITFLIDAFSSLKQLNHKTHELLEGFQEEKQDCLTAIKEAESEANLEFFLSEGSLALEQSVDGVDRVRKIVHAMKEFSHPGEDKPTLVDLNGAIASTITVCRSEWKTVAEMITHFDPDLPLVPCYSSEINQVVLNIIVNASHAIAELKTTHKMEEMGNITVSTQQDADWVEVRISDTGGGIPESLHGKIFDPFFTTKEVGKGTGLGLSIVHGIIEKKHGGRITFETKVGKGTTFIIRLPLTSADASIEKQKQFY